MTNEELIILAEKVKAGTASEEEATQLTQGLTKLLSETREIITKK